MKVKVALVFVLLFIISCRESIEAPDETYIKVYGNEGLSYGEKIKQIDGRTMILGKTSRLKFVSQQVSEEKILPSVFISNASGNIIDKRLYDVAAILESDNQISLVDVQKLSDRTFQVYGEWQGIPDHYLNFKINLPFRIHLDSKFSPLDFEPLNNSLWDPIVRTDPMLFDFGQGSNYLLYRQTFHNNTDNPIRHSLQQLNDLGEVQWSLDYIRPSIIAVNAAWDLEQGNLGELLVLAQHSNDVVIYRIQENNGGEISRHVLDETVFQDRYEWPGSLVKLENGYAAVYRIRSGNVTCQFLDEDLSKGKRLTISQNNSNPKDEIVVDAEPTPDGHLVILTRDQEPTNSEITGYIRKVSKEGNLLWEYFLDGIPEDVEILEDSILVIYNPIYNGQQRKTTVLKIRLNGTL